MVEAALHCLELKKLQLEHEVLFALVTANVVAWFAASGDTTQFPEQVRPRVISQLICSISKVP